MSKRQGMTTPRKKVESFELRYTISADGDHRLAISLLQEQIDDLILGLFFGGPKESRQYIYETIVGTADTGRVVLRDNAYEIAKDFQANIAFDLVEFADDGNVYEVGPLTAAPDGKHQA